MRGLSPFWRQTASRARGRKCHPARANRHRRAPSRHPAHARPAVSGSHRPPRGGANPHHGVSPCFPLPESVVPSTPPHSTYRLRTSSGSEMAGVANAGTRAGAVRAGISEAAADAAAAQEAPAFSRGNQLGGAASGGSAYHPGPGAGESRTYHAQRGRTMCGQSAEQVVSRDCACVRWARTPLSGQSSGLVQAPPPPSARLLAGGAAPELFIHSLGILGDRAASVPRGYSLRVLKLKPSAPT